MSHYDREADIAFLDVEPFDGQKAVGENHEWGLVIRDRVSGRVVALELWKASARLPGDLLTQLPKPKAEGLVFERQSA